MGQEEHNLGQGEQIMGQEGQKGGRKSEIPSITLYKVLPNFEVKNYNVRNRAGTLISMTICSKWIVQ